MSDLISRKALLNIFEERMHDDNVMCPIIKVLDVLEIVDDAPTVEAKEVVRKPIKGFEGLYDISNFGEVRNSKGEIKKHGIKRTPCTCYKTVRLWKDGKYHTKYIHRLIAEAFIPNPQNLPFINHKDEDGTNNSIENLEWCTREYNVNYGTARMRQAKKIRGRESEKRKGVYQFDSDGKFVAYYPSITLASEETCCSRSAISEVCRGKRESTKGYLWKFEDGTDMRTSAE